MNIASRVLKNFLSLSAAGLVHSVVAVVSTIYLARVLEPEGYGRISFAFAFVQYFLTLSAFGLDIVGVRSVAREKDKVKEYVGNIMAIKLTVSLVLFIALVVIIPLLGRPTETNKMMLIYGLVLFPSALFFEWTWQGLESGGLKMIRHFRYLAFNKGCFCFQILLYDTISYMVGKRRENAKSR